jgi:hypothetical protein
MRPLLALTPLLALACAAPEPPALLDAALPQGRLTQPLTSLLAGGGLAPGSAQSVRELGPTPTPATTWSGSATRRLPTAMTGTICWW